MVLKKMANRGYKDIYQPEIDLLAKGRRIGGTGSGHVTLLSNTRSYMSTKPGQLHTMSISRLAFEQIKSITKDEMIRAVKKDGFEEDGKPGL